MSDPFEEFKKRALERAEENGASAPSDDWVLGAYAAVEMVASVFAKGDDFAAAKMIRSWVPYPEPKTDSSAKQVNWEPGLIRLAKEMSECKEDSKRLPLGPAKNAASARFNNLKDAFRVIIGPGATETLVENTIKRFERMAKENDRGK